MAGKYDDLASQIVELVGGKSNVKSVAHCITRVRFKLKDEAKANDEAISELPNVIKVMHANGQYQVVVGNIVEDVYDSVLRAGGFSDGGAVDADDDDAAPKGVTDVIIDLISGIFAPMLGTFAAGQFNFNGVAHRHSQRGVGHPLVIHVDHLAVHHIGVQYKALDGLRGLGRRGRRVGLVGGGLQHGGGTCQGQCTQGQRKCIQRELFHGEYLREVRADLPSPGSMHGTGQKKMKQKQMFTWIKVVTTLMP